MRLILLIISTFAVWIWMHSGLDLSYTFHQDRKTFFITLIIMTLYGSANIYFGQGSKKD